jgi:hypothetical protein
MRRTLAAAILGLATAAAAAETPPSTSPSPAPTHKPRQATPHASTKPPASAKPQAANPAAAPRGRNEEAIAKLKEAGKREAERLAPKAGRAEKIVREQAPKVVDRVVDFAAELTGAAPTEPAKSTGGASAEPAKK